MMMPKMYCLTLRQHPERRARAEAEFARHGLAVEFVEGIHGPTLGLVPTLPVFDQREYRMPAGRVGLWLSYLLLWRLLLERTDETVLLFQDDVRLCENFASELQASMAALPTGWQVAFAGHCCIDDKPTEKVNDRISIVRYPLCMHALLLQRRTIPLILQHWNSCSSHADITLAQRVLPLVPTYTFTPSLAWQEPPPGKETTTTKTQSWKDIQGWFDFKQLYEEQVAQAVGPSVFVEIGSWKGRSAACMGRLIQHSLKPITFYAVDTWKGTIGHKQLQADVAAHGGDIFPMFWRNMLACGVCDYVTPIRKPSVEAARDFADQSVDFVFVDGDHSTEACTADIRAWRPKLKPGGCMAGHDMDRDTVQRAVRQEFGKNFRTWERCWIVDRVS